MKKSAYLIFSLVVLFSCKEIEVRNQEIRGEAQGTTFFISYSDSLNRDFSTDVAKILTEFDKELSIYFPNSLVSKFNRNELKIINNGKDKYLSFCINKSEKIQKITDGYFNHGLKNLINFTKNKSSFVRRDSLAIDSILSISNFILPGGNFDFKEDKRAKFDFNAIAQGYSVDVLGDFLEAKGVKNYMVEIGGELKVKGKNQRGEKWSVGLESPNSTVKERDFQEIIYLENKSLATSGSYRKFKEINDKKYSHVINPKTGFGVTHNLLSVSVIAENCIIADALATTFLVMGKEKTISFLDSYNSPIELEENIRDISVYFIESNDNGEFETSYYNGFENYLD